MSRIKEKARQEVEKGLLKHILYPMVISSG